MEKKSAIDALQALAQDTRLTVFLLLVEAGPDGVAAGRIAGMLGIAPSVLSFHLNHLAQASLVTSRRQGRQVIYMAAYDVMEDLVGFLFENCCRGAGDGRAAIEDIPETTTAARDQEP